MPMLRDRTARTRLVEIVRTRSYQTGPEMTLASGRTSTHYFNMKPTMLDPEGAYLIAELVIEQLVADKVKADMIGGLELGAVPIASAVCAVSHQAGHPIRAFLVRKQAKDHGTKSLVEGLAKGETLHGKKVVIVEDVTTTGGSSIKAAEAVRKEGAEVVRVITIVDRQEGAAEAFKAAGLSLHPILTMSDFVKA